MGPFGNRPSSMGQNPGRRRGIKLWPLLLFGAYFAYYYFSHSNEASFTGRNQLLDTTARQEAALGFQSYREILSQSRVVRDGPNAQLVVDIAGRLVAVAPKVEQYLAESARVPATTDWSAFQWEAALIQSDQVNAFCLPGGKIAVYTGILPVAQNSDGLAAIMGHEIAHALLRHGGERMAQQKLVQIGSIAASMSTGEMDPQQRQMVMAAIGAGAQYGLLLPFSRSHESEADRVGLLLSAAACYDPREAPKLWERMAALGRQKPPEFMSTHPAEGTRIAQLQQWMPEALQVHQQFCGAAAAR
ncbi:M48 family metallopeptidase [Dokdonella sp.]|uniref:M48 family metallopeptidase n=1 Tax=Dokdonella sp. TaxID=2291710 RepID=UPI0025C31014|nr:M48 family metallopeptidase [Dokdonella sp.]